MVNDCKKNPCFDWEILQISNRNISGLIGDELIIDKGSTEVMDGSFVKIKN
ncbi:MAG: hypothetical protein Ct9H90mP3_3430 [Flammeovirgaceae bacterium]|nr:MAG: hypothetical protein Ct9H90mP3_3430 [Flammeovirgaceae bacterium]